MGVSKTDKSVLLWHVSSGETSNKQTTPHAEISAKKENKDDKATAVREGTGTGLGAATTTWKPPRWRKRLKVEGIN